MNRAFVLAAGLGTRLRPLTEYRPKPLVPICGVPLLAYSLALCARHGLREVMVNAHWLADQILPWQGEREGVRVSVSPELPDVLGTGGGMRRVIEELESPFAVLNADVLHDVDLTALLAAVPEGGAAMVLRPDEQNAPRYGIVAQDSTGRVVELTDVARAEAKGPVDRTTHFTGIHAMTRDALMLVPSQGASCVIRTAYRALVPQRQVAATRYHGLWLDAGDPAAYLDANLQILSGRHALALDPFARAAFARTADGRLYGDPAVVRGATIRGSVWVGHDVRVGSGVLLEDAVVGDGVFLPDGLRLQRSVVWDGVTDSLDPRVAVKQAIVYTGGILQVG